MFSDPWQRVAVFISPVIGHIFSVWLGFKGGKGVACVLGTLLAMFSWQQILLAILIWGVALKAVKIMSLVNMILVSLLPPVLWYMYRHPAYLVYGIGVLTIILYAHRSNISRLLKGTELKLPI